MLWYEERITFLQTSIEYILNKINIREKETIGLFIAAIHYTLFFVLYLTIFITDSPIFINVCLVVLVIQLFLNVVDNGCIIMKLERKYLGKKWFGITTILGDLLGVHVERKHSLAIFYTFSVLGIIIGYYKFAKWFYDWYLYTTLGIKYTYSLVRNVINGNLISGLTYYTLEYIINILQLIKQSLYKYQTLSLKMKTE
jgi:hypothetical protein